MNEAGCASVDAIERQIAIILVAWGMPRDLAADAARVMSATDLSGIDSHGLQVMPMYDQMRKEGKLRLAAVPGVVTDRASMAVIDAGGSLGHPAGVKAMRLAMEKARGAGIAAVCVVNSHHYGAAGYYAQMAAEEGLIGLSTTSTRFVSMVPTFGGAPVLSTNPLAFAAPAGRNPPVVLDMATSVVAIQKIKVYARRGKPLPEGWVVDGHGRPVTDAEEALRYILERPEGGVLPLGGTREMGGHKGYGLALMVHILASTLVGGSFSPVRNRTQAPSDPENIGHFFMAIDPAVFRPLADFGRDMDEVIDTLHATQPAEPGQPVLVPGDPEREARAQRRLTGIPVDASLRAEIRAIAAAAGVDYVLDTVGGTA
ncbi:Ldh family oxidoreductase [Bosea sp. (in: a-proteobacteria)]|uniref:Ldh family oxidoreductase n=1 Tax=Bosea sp. (in: a-proteobacteria) TaxID=1871050 RepID=UPI00262D105C|nr:Ldh family oxidoreductase [Bosea sp. (in: a-proteobacteria)]MCO5089805.1 Ldh family oxidoreductase [Bosea sp. (in: a-proteobacteria)]